MSLKYMALTTVMAALALAQQAPSPWPAQLTTDDGQVTLFQPQLDSFQGDQLSTRLAVSVQINGEQDPVFGAVWLSEQVQVDDAARTVHVLSVSVSRSRFPNDDPLVSRAVSDAVAQFFSGRNVTLSLDKLQATLTTLQKEQTAAAQVQVDAPKVVFLDHPAVKVQYDGAPRLVAVENSNLLRAVNTPFFVVLDPSARQYFLKGGGRWFVASDPLGPFQQVGQAPDQIAALADSSGYQDPQQPVQAGDVEIVTATDPTELIWTSGPEQLGVISNTGLLYVANTDSDVFVTIDTRQYYVLLSGRWYTSPGHDGPWAFVSPDQLPDDFHRIPPDSPKADVLVSIPGTQAADDAVADSYVPQTAAVDVNQFEQPPVAYDGDPDFEPIEGTSLSYAVNTDASVVLVGGQYYCCHDAVWYSGGGPGGPWQIATYVPAEIYTIPPSCPIYPVRFVYIYGRTSNAVYFGYLPGYVGSYVYRGVVVYGTGWHYRPWVGRIYFPRPYTYGFAAHYDFYTGHWGFNFAIALGGGDGWISIGAADRFHGRAWFGHDGFRPVYARDSAHMADARRIYAADAARHNGFAANVYERRADIRPELPHGGPVPRQAAIAHEDERRSEAPPARENSGGYYHPQHQEQAPAESPRQTPSRAFQSSPPSESGNAARDQEPAPPRQRQAAPAESGGSRQPPPSDSGRSSGGSGGGEQSRSREQQAPAQSPQQAPSKDRPNKQPPQQQGPP
jgi:hypothetical protein